MKSFFLSQPSQPYPNPSVDDTIFIPSPHPKFPGWLQKHRQVSGDMVGLGRVLEWLHFDRHWEKNICNGVHQMGACPRGSFYWWLEIWNCFVSCVSLWPGCFYFPLWQCPLQSNTPHRRVTNQLMQIVHTINKLSVILGVYSIAVDHKSIPNNTHQGLEDPVLTVCTFYWIFLPLGHNPGPACAWVWCPYLHRLRICSYYTLCQICTIMHHNALLYVAWKEIVMGVFYNFVLLDLGKMWTNTWSQQNSLTTRVCEIGN